jgi:hypothetical protein
LIVSNSDSVTCIASIVVQNYFVADPFVEEKLLWSFLTLTHYTGAAAKAWLEFPHLIVVSYSISVTETSPSARARERSPVPLSAFFSESPAVGQFSEWPSYPINRTYKDFSLASSFSAQHATVVSVLGLQPLPRQVLSVGVSALCSGDTTTGSSAYYNGPSQISPGGTFSFQSSASGQTTVDT